MIKVRNSSPNERAGGDGGIPSLFHTERARPAAPQHECEAAIARMKSIIALFICCLALLRAVAADEPLIPAPLNSVLLKIQPGMRTNQVMAILSPLGMYEQRDKTFVVVVQCSSHGNP